MDQIDLDVDTGTDYSKSCGNNVFFGVKRTVRLGLVNLWYFRLFIIIIYLPVVYIAGQNLCKVPKCRKCGRKYDGYDGRLDSIAAF